MLNSNDAALTCACDSRARALDWGGQKKQRQREREKVIRRKNAMDKCVEVVEEQSTQHFDLLLIGKKQY